MKKKAQFSLVQTLVIVFIVAVILFALVGKLQAGFRNNLRGDDCLAGVILKTQTTFEKGAGLLKYEGIDSSCPAYNVKIFEDRTEILKGAKKFKTKKYDELTENELFGILADELRYCWKQFGAGETDVFWYPASVIEKLSLSSNKKGCKICSKIEFGESISTKEFDGFYDYLKTHTFKTKMKIEGEEKESFYDYIAEKDRFCQAEYEKGENCWETYAEKNGLEVNNKIYSNKQYFIILTRQGLKQEEGTINAYLVRDDQYTNHQLCNSPLPFK